MCRDRRISLTAPSVPSLQCDALLCGGRMVRLCWVGAVNAHFRCATTQRGAGTFSGRAGSTTGSPTASAAPLPSLPGASLLLGTLDRILLLLLSKKLYLYMRSKLLSLARGVCLLPSWGQRPCREKHRIVTQMYEEHRRCADLRGSSSEVCDPRWPGATVLHQLLSGNPNAGYRTEIRG